MITFPNHQPSICVHTVSHNLRRQPDFTAIPFLCQIYKINSSRTGFFFLEPSYSRSSFLCTPPLLPPTLSGGTKNPKAATLHQRTVFKPPMASLRHIPEVKTAFAHPSSLSYCSVDLKFILFLL
jgi:hypothetical protein